MEYKQNLRSNEKKGLMDAIAKAMEIATPAAAALPLIAGAQEAQALDVQNENNLRKDSTKVRKDNSQNNPTKGYIAGGFSAFKDYFGATQFDTFLGGGLKIKPGDFLIFDTIDLELVTKPYSYEDQTHTTELGFEGSIGVSKNMPTGLDRLMRQFAEGLKYALDLKGGSRKFYSQERLEDLFQLKDLRPDLMNLNYLQLGLAGGYGEEGFQILGYIDIPILGTWDEAVGFKEKGDYEKWNFGVDFRAKVKPFLNVDITFDGQIDNLLNRIKQEMHKLKIGVDHEFNDLKILKILGSDFSLEKAAAYLTMNYFGLTGQGRIKSYQDDSLYPGVEANGVFRLGNVVFIPTIGWNNEQKLYGGLVVAYNPKNK